MKYEKKKRNKMAKLQILTQFGQLFTEVNQTLDFYNENLKNNLFQKDEKESNEKAYKRGEGIFDQFDENLNNINLILHLENEIQTLEQLAKLEKSPKPLQ